MDAKSREMGIKLFAGHESGNITDHYIKKQNIDKVLLLKKIEQRG
jgi:hypothetical protein